MNKKRIIILIFIFLILIFFVWSIIFIKDARENRTWPFNSSIGLYLPQWVKFYAYKFTNPDEKIITTQYYKIKIDYVSVPNKETVGGGGAINLIEDNSLLLTLNDGSNYLFDTKDKNFLRTKGTFKNYLGVRDVYYDKKENKILLLGIKEKSNEECKVIVLDIYIPVFEERNLNFTNLKNIWTSEELCNDPLENNGGGRVIEFQNNYFISTGFFSQNLNSGIFPYPQDPKSSFGKIIKISKDGKKNEIYSLGHRNPQGLFAIEKRNLLISSEHGPQGGDEINIIRQNNNYGWPCETWGAKYDYNFSLQSEIWPDQKFLEKYGCSEIKKYTQPLFSWSPSIAASQGLHYNGKEFPKFQDHIILGSLKATSIFRMFLSEEEKIINFEKIFLNERVRDITLDQNGKIFIYSDSGNILIISRYLEK